MQKFTRALTREIEVAGERLAVTLDAAGLTVRPVGSRRQPYTLSWAACVCAVAGQFASEDPPPEGELAEAIKTIKAGAPKDGEAVEKKPKAGTGNPAPAAPAHPAAPVPPSEGGAPVSSTPPAPARAESPVPALLARVDRWLAAHRERFHRGLLPGAGDAELAALKEALGAPVPAELAELLRWHNGQSPDVPGALEGGWNLMSAAEIAAAKKALDAEPPAGWRSGWVPILEDDTGGSRLALDTTHPGNPVRAAWQGKPEHETVAPSLAAWLQDFVTALEAGKYHEDPERGTFQRTK
jgi:cell wall assembly regulator SMI1